MSAPARWSITRHPPNYRENFKTEYSDPHVLVELALIRAGFNPVGEVPILCEPCQEPNCHHEWKPDIRIVGTNVLVDVHRPDGDADDQEARKRCLENSGWIVVQVTDRDPPSVAVEQVRRTLKLAEVVEE